MKFPGSKLLHNWDLSAQNLSLDDLLRSCQQVGLTGFAEVKTPTAVAMIFYYLGGEVNALYREGAWPTTARSRSSGCARRRPASTARSRSTSCPLDMAHLLRGITNRQKLKETLTSKADLVEFLRPHGEGGAHRDARGADRRGAAMVLLVSGRVSNIYWETTGGLTFEKGEARKRLEEALDRQEATLFLSEFSRDVWKSRHEVQASVRSKLEGEASRGRGSAHQRGDAACASRSSTS